jgi:hypothetical protein
MMSVYWSIGIGEGNDKVDTVELEPKFVSVEPKKGSAGGTIITIDIQGVGLATQGDIKVRDVTGKSICQSVSIASYGVVKCHTIAGDIASTALKITIGTDDFTCANSKPAECKYEQLESSASTPVITTLTASADKKELSFDGTNLPTTGYFGKSDFGGISSSPLTNATANTNVKAKWEFGLAYSNNAEYPVVRFEEAATGHVYFAVVKKSLSQNKQVSGSSNGMGCSFAGGCLFNIAGQGVTSKLL